MTKFLSKRQTWANEIKAYNNCHELHRKHRCGTHCSAVNNKLFPFILLDMLFLFFRCLFIVLFLLVALHNMMLMAHEGKCIHFVWLKHTLKRNEIWSSWRIDLTTLRTSPLVLALLLLHRTKCAHCVLVGNIPWLTSLCPLQPAAYSAPSTSICNWDDYPGICYHA